MQHFYKTSEIAKKIGIHPNTVRLYEELGFISAPKRQPNGYRIFNALHLAQLRLARTALQVEVLQNGLRRKSISIIKAAARQEFNSALLLTGEYIVQIQQEKANAEEAAAIAQQLFLARPAEQLPQICLQGRKEVAKTLHLSVDTLRNWERNGLLEIRQQNNGIRIYTAEDLNRLKIIRALRCGNYSLAAILRLLRTEPGTNIRSILDTPREEDIISACDHLLTSLDTAEKNARDMRRSLIEMKKIAK